jgi:hypothetical protein
MNRTDVKIVQISLDLQSQREIESYNSLSQLGYTMLLMETLIGLLE